MSHPPFYDGDMSPTRVSSSYISNNYTGGFSVKYISNGRVIITTNYYQSCEPQKREIVETKKEKLDRTSKEKMLASWKTYDQKDMNIIKIKQICKPQHKLNYRYKR